MTILDTIVANKHLEIEQLKIEFDVSYFKEQPGFNRQIISLKQSFLSPEFGIIAEIKRKSPSGGNIQPDLDPAKLAVYYQNCGARAISVLTDLNYFGGTIEDIKTVRKTVDLPVLRKEFILDEIQLYEARSAGADAVLLIASILKETEIKKLTDTAHSIGLEVLFEIHSHEELSKIYSKVDLIAVNNRNLAQQETSLHHSLELVSWLPRNTPLISASGISTYGQIEQLKSAGFNGALIGESILRNQHLNQLIPTL